MYICVCVCVCVCVCLLYILQHPSFLALSLIISLSLFGILVCQINTSIIITSSHVSDDIWGELERLGTDRRVVSEVPPCICWFILLYQLSWYLIKHFSSSFKRSHKAKAQPLRMHCERVTAAFMISWPVRGKEKGVQNLL